MALVERDTRSGPPPPPPTTPPSPTPSRRNRVVAVIVALAVVVLAAVVIAATATGGSNHTKPRLAGGPAATAPAITNQVPSPTAPTATSPSTAAGASSNPADWPAAQSNPPSLAGATNSADMPVVVRTLSNYKDWVYAHPDRALVANYQLATSNNFYGDTKQLQTLAANHWHDTANPTAIKYIRVTLPPKLVSQPNGRPIYNPALVTVVLNYAGGETLDANGRPVITNPTNDMAYSFALAYGTDGQWRISNIYQLNPPGGIASIEQQQ